MDKKNENIEPVGIIIITHANYGAALLSATESILGSIPNCVAMSVDMTADVEETVNKLRDTVESMDKGNGVLILTDMFGGTPTNLSLSLLSTDSVEVVTGVNLPMILRAASQNPTRVELLAEEARLAGVQGIISASEMLVQKKG